MRRHLLLPAFLLLLAAPAANAAPSEICAQIKNLPPVSDNYVRRVLERADDGIEFAKSAPDSSDADRYRGSWALMVITGWAQLLDAQITRTDEERELSQVTACLHFDQLLLDCKMDEVREELRTSVDRGSLQAIRRLLALLEFLQQRKKSLTAGALDPLYSDPTWGVSYAFDNPDEYWCCPQNQAGNICTQLSQESCDNYQGGAYLTLNACTEAGCVPPEGEDPDDGVLCPFNADYAPAFESGFGCDIDVLQPRADYEPLAAELEALTIIKEQVDTYRRNGRDLLEVQQRIDDLFENESTTPEVPPERKHVQAFGCGWTAGYCTNDDEIRCSSDEECGNGTCEIPDGVCEGNRAIRCGNDSQCGDNGPCSDEAELPAVRALRGPFSLEKDQIAILADFLGERAAQEISRSFEDDLKVSTEFPEDRSEESDLRSYEDRNPLLQIFRNAGRQSAQAWSRVQARMEALIFPEAVDAPLEVAESLKDLRGAVSDLSKLASEKDGLRAFVARYAYFINRTCVYRPCQMMLEQVIRIVTTDECFPYTNGEYLSDDPDSPRWEKCKQAAEID